ncbi:MAG TPA: ATP-binding protein [Cyclobacteriaceae bacterium]|jgi:signal transduction histidine kinase|nr:ATP-binding protein [Cyclobacteriaceae bacterium]
MNIRNRITLRFILIVAVIILGASLLIYIFSADYREDEFYNRLQSKANNTAKLLIEVDEVDVTLLRKIEKDNPVSLPNEKIIIFDFQNKILFTTDEEKEIKIDTALLDQIRLENEIRFRQGNYEVLGFLFKGPFDRFAVVTAATDIYGVNKLKNLRTILLIVFTISILGVSIAGWFFAGKALQPISRVVHQVDDISITSLNLRVDEGNGKDEIAQLAKTFNNMLNRLETSFIIQKNFIANASHELRTPLTAITGQLEVILLNERSREEYKGVIISVLDDIKSLNTLSNRLLLLAQTSSDGLERKTTQLRIDELIWQTREELFKHNFNFIINIDLDTDLDDETKLIIEGDEQLIKAAISNIIENGCKYSADHTTDVLISSSESGLTLRFEDSGIGIPAEDLKHIYEPFYRGQNTKNITGHGIGMSLVKRIVTFNGGALDISSELGVGTVVILTFPYTST